MRRTLPLLIVLCSPSFARADYSFSVDTKPGSGVELEVRGYYDKIPPHGFLPVAITITNNSGRNRSWTFDFEASRGVYQDIDVHRMRFVAQLDNQDTRRWEVLVPLLPVTASHRQTRLQVVVQGYGIRPHYAAKSDRLEVGYFLGASEALEALTNLTLPHSLEHDGLSFKVESTNFTPKTLPNDWRGLMGFDLLWLVVDDLESLSAVQRGALVDWVAQGGWLFVWYDPDRDKPPFGLPIRSSSSGEPHGLGWAVNVPLGEDKWDNDLAESARVIERFRPRGHRMASFETPAEFKDAGAVNRPVMILFLLLFGLLVGPINLFYFGRRAERARLLWTTPMLSLGATLLLLLLIFIQDGIGGTGERFSITVLLPEQHRAVQIQEQVARTGVVLRNRFPLTDSYLDRFIHNEGRHEDALIRTPEGYEGDWFRSRSIAPLLVQQIRASRARVELTDPQAVSQGYLPTVVSTLSIPLEPIFYYGADGRVFHSERARPGEPVALQPVDLEVLEEWVRKQEENSFGYLKGVLTERKQLMTGYFYGAAQQPGIDTLPSIRWEDRSSIYLGPVVGAKMGGRALPVGDPRPQAEGAQRPTGAKMGGGALPVRDPR